ncbi:MAG TPA: NAD(P)-dependent oxidoreductase [Bauldia sp.]
MQIDFVGPQSFELMYQPSLDALAAGGHKGRWFKTPAEYWAAADPANLDVLVAIGALKVGADFLDQAPNLRALISPVTGTEGFDEAAASARNVLVANGQILENYVSMAEATVMLILAALYDLNGTQRLLAENGPRPPRPRARMLMRKTVGLIGFGQIARAVAARLESWDCRILTTMRTARALPDRVKGVPLGTLLTESDVVVVLAALNDDTRAMLGERKLSAMKPDVVFVNVARGGIADEHALARLARERPEMRIAVDVFSPDPLPLDSPLRSLPNAILTPHMVGHTRETLDRLPVVLLANIEHVLAGEVPDYVRNPKVIDAWRARWSGREAV